MEEKLKITFKNELGVLKKFEFFLIESKNYDYYSVWETMQYPIMRITQEDYDYFKSGKDIEILSGDIDEEDKEMIANFFNEHIDKQLNRPIKLRLVISQLEDNQPFEYGEIFISTYYESDTGFVKNKSFVQIMNNLNGYAPIEYSFDQKLNDRFLKVDKLKIGYKLPSWINRAQSYFSDEVIYQDHPNKGIVRAISNESKSPRLDVKVSFINDLNLNGIDIINSVFLGILTEYILI